MTKKRILYCESNTDGTIGGSFYSLLFLVDGLDKNRFDPLVIFYSENSLIPTYRDAGIDTRVLPKPRPYQFAHAISKHGLPGRLVGKLLAPLQKMMNLLRFLIMPVINKFFYLRKNRIDLVHLNNSIIRNNDWMIAAKLAGIKCITHERGINDSYPRLARWLAPRLDAVICISHAVANNMTRCGIPADNLHIIYNGLDPDVIQITADDHALRAEYHINPNDPIIGIIGNIKEWKGQKSVVLATALVKERFPDVRCFLVGDTAEADIYYKEEIKKLINEHNLEKNIIFTGYQSNVANYINLMDIVIHASVEPEPFGRVLIEAMALKKPLIGARAGAVPEIIVENVTGLTFTPDNSSELASCTMQLLDEPDKATQMGKLGYQRLVQEFHIRANVQRTMEVYDSLTGT